MKTKKQIKLRIKVEKKIWYNNARIFIKFKNETFSDEDSFKMENLYLYLKTIKNMIKELEWVIK